MKGVYVLFNQKYPMCNNILSRKLSNIYLIISTLECYLVSSEFDVYVDTGIRNEYIIVANITNCFVALVICVSLITRNYLHHTAVAMNSLRVTVSYTLQLCVAV